MENRPKLGRLTFLGNPSPWLKQFLGTLQQTGTFEIQTETDVNRFLQVPSPKSRVHVVLFEQTPQSRELVLNLRRSNRRFILIWIGKAFSKEEALFAVEQRIHTVLENPQSGNPSVAEQFGRALARADSAERSEDLIFSIKSVLLQLTQDGNTNYLLEELKTGLSKFERNAVQSEFLGDHALPGGTKVPFYKTQGLSDAILMVEDLGRTGRLTVKGKGIPETGRLEFLQGRLVSALSGESRGLKAIFRMFLWDEPEFNFAHREAAETVMQEPFTLSLRTICDEGEGLRARFAKIRSQLPPGSLKLQMEMTALNGQTRLNRDEFSTLSSVVELGKVAQVIDYNPLPDVVLYECLIGLKRQGVIKVVAA